MASKPRLRYAPSVAEPLLPFIKVPIEIPLGFLLDVPLIGDKLDAQDPPSIKVFGILVATGVYLGSIVAMRHARERRIDSKLRQHVRMKFAENPERDLWPEL